MMIRIGCLGVVRGRAGAPKSKWRQELISSPSHSLEGRTRQNGILGSSGPSPFIARLAGPVLPLAFGLIAAGKPDIPPVGKPPSKLTGKPVSQPSVRVR
jgi:hypothetical protein